MRWISTLLLAVSLDKLRWIRSALTSMSKEGEKSWLFNKLRREDWFDILGVKLKTLALPECEGLWCGKAPGGSSHGLGNLGSIDGCRSVSSLLLMVAHPIMITCTKLERSDIIDLIDMDLSISIIISHATLADIPVS